MSASPNTTLPPYLFDAAKAAEEANAAAAEDEKEGKELLWNPEFLRTTKGMLLVAQVVSHPSHARASIYDVNNKRFLTPRPLPFVSKIYGLLVCLQIFRYILLDYSVQAMCEN